MKDYILSTNKLINAPTGLYTIASSWSDEKYVYTMDREGDIYRCDFNNNMAELFGSLDIEDLNMAYAEKVLCVGTDTLMFVLCYGYDPTYTLDVYAVDLDTLTYSKFITHTITAGGTDTFNAATYSSNVIEKIGNDIYYRYYFEDTQITGNDVIYYTVFKNGLRLVNHNTRQYNFGINVAFPLVTNIEHKQFMFGYYPYGSVKTDEYNGKFGFTYVDPPTQYNIPSGIAEGVQPFEFDGYIWAVYINSFANTVYSSIYRIDANTLKCELYNRNSFESEFEFANPVAYLKTNDYVIIMDGGYRYFKFSKTTFTINLYKNSAEANRVDKTNYLTAVGSLNGVMREGSSITDLSITFEMDTLPQFNYVHIPAFNRYYYVNGIDTIKYRLWRMNLSVDPLMTYKDAILSCSAFIDRNEYEYNANIIDNKMVIEQGVDVEVVEFGNDIAPLDGEDFWNIVINGYKISPSFIEEES